jgi:hypothetical protein
MQRMTAALSGFVIVTGCALAAQQHDAHKAGGGTASVQAKIRDAMSAGPADISRNAAIADFPDTPNGQMKQLRAGTNGWTCMPSTGSGGGVGADPMCLDKAWMAWADAYMSKKDPPAGASGIGYMLRGDKGASNTDPFATAPTADNHWVKSGPHIMVLFASQSQLDAFPTEPGNGGPFVMWKGTKYAHLMVPTAPMPKAASKAAAAAPAKK